MGKTSIVNMKIKKCSKCLEEKNLQDFYYHRTRKRYMASCKDCNSKSCSTYQTRKRKDVDLKFIFMMRAVEIRRRCKAKEIPFDSNLKEVLKDQWEKQNGICFYSGRKLNISNDYHENPFSVTVDRVKPELGYVKGNLVFCCSIYNRMKQNLSYEEFVNCCKEVIQNQSSCD
jgi:hypothetical protein